MTKLIHDYQYQQQSFEVDFNLLPFQLEVCKDDVIRLVVSAAGRIRRTAPAFRDQGHTN